LIVPVFGQTKNPKRGISYGYHTEEDFKAISGTLSWWYNWAVTPESAPENEASTKKLPCLRVISISIELTS